MAQTFFPITPTEITPANPNAWETMDASAVGVPANATGVVLHIYNNVLGSPDIGVRKNGSTDDRHGATGAYNHFWVAIGVDASRIFEAYIDDITDIDVYVVGYTMAGVAFNTNADNMSLGVTGSWQPIDCSTEAPSAIGLIFEITFVGIYEFGFKKNGSSDDRHVDGGNHSSFCAVIGCDGSQVCEGYIENVAVDFFLLGYITDGCTFNTNATDVSLGTADSWLDLSALPAGANMGFIEVTSPGTDYYGLRKNGSAEDLYHGAARHPWGIVECDASQIIEGKIENLTVDFFVVGYSEAPPAPAGIADKSANMGAKLIAGKLI